MPVIPISPHRGLSHIKNPRAKDKDILLLLLYEGDEMIGYLGLLPDDLYVKDKIIHCAWMSCIWVSKNARGKGVAKKMVQKAYEVWDGKILATEFTPEAYLLYEKLKLFDDFLTKKGWRIYTRFVTAEVLPRKKSWLKLFSLFLKLFDGSANLLVDKKWDKQFKSLDFKNFIFAENKFSGENPITGENGFNRTAKEISWMITYPWLKEYEEDVDKKYHFSSSAKQVKNILVEDTQNGKRMLMFVRDSHLKTSFVWGNWHRDAIKKVLFYVIRTYKISVITSYFPEITEVMIDLPYLFQKPQERRYLIGKKMKASFPTDFSCFVQDGDGDCGFT